MTRKEVERDIEGAFGRVPMFFKTIPDNLIELEWKVFKATQLEPSVLPAKYKELIGLGIAAATKCRYCALFHTEAAKLNGATDAEIEEAVHFAKETAGWSAYLNGLQFDFEKFREELRGVMDFVKKSAKPGVAAQPAPVH